jgi:hypothetical protein
VYKLYHQLNYDPNIVYSIHLLMKVYHRPDISKNFTNYVAHCPIAQGPCLHTKETDTELGISPNANANYRDYIRHYNHPPLIQ